MAGRTLGTVAVVAAVTMATLGAAATAAEESPEGGGAGPTAQPRDGWKLVHSENFARFSPRGDTGWFRDHDGPGSPYDVDEYDNDGDYFRTFGGQDFDRHLDSIELYRRSFEFGRDGWLTAELAGRDTDGTGVENEAPSFGRSVLAGAGPTGRFEVPTHHGGAIVRSTDPLPEEYRVEVKLRSVDFGGQRNGAWDYDGMINGYRPTGCTTNFPWAGASTWDYSRAECDWFDVTQDANGFYYLSIMDYERPAPRNNVFIHTHRKVVMDGYNRYRYTGRGLRYCDATTGELQPYEWGSGNGVNMLFMLPEPRYANQPGTEYLMPSECGTEVGGGIVSQADLMPELMPRVAYTFAIERRDGAYVLEVSGLFRHIGYRTLRYEQPFDDGENPIFRYNQTEEEYDGRHNTTWTLTSGDTTYVHEDVWPAGSAYPDYFLIGQPHMNFYEGTAHIDDIRLYVPSS